MDSWMDDYFQFDCTVQYSTVQAFDRGKGNLTQARFCDEIEEAAVTIECLTVICPEQANDQSLIHLSKAFQPPVLGRNRCRQAISKLTMFTVPLSPSLPFFCLQYPPKPVRRSRFEMHISSACTRNSSASLHYLQYIPTSERLGRLAKLTLQLAAVEK
jgi:hypothetical protein